MPELPGALPQQNGVLTTSPEVERARRLIAETCTGYTIGKAETYEDTIVYDGASHDEFDVNARESSSSHTFNLEANFKILDYSFRRRQIPSYALRHDRNDPGQEPTWYRRKVNLGEGVDGALLWPPKLTPPDVAGEARELAFLDPRRLGRLRLVPDPVLSHPPLSLLGFDPVLSHPSLDEFKGLLENKRGTVKGLIMDQAFSAGVGNWVADECHPIQDLEEAQVVELHRLLRDVPMKACEVNADSALFPTNWLFKWRWGKGAKKKKKAVSSTNGDVKVEQPAFLALVGNIVTIVTDVEPDGSPATITFVTVGGRTSAVVTELQKMPSKKAAAAKRKRNATDASDTETDEPPKQRRPRPKVKRKVVRVKKVCFKEVAV
ncbi:hypothetical protein A1Q2_06065 [Trichosporon asahii var. asahii CBS 8904]|uniref:Formamidopyrimidine-DNA glycosylase catalytic domain-containing protein n=1 Tax=Trichosporon asahii var. asahii (strain CBS 8904) TaxID=1220162 RepID=K1VKE7_TRIAC|nr:hypothetical protein A1Q2_06065 [Trichosporon asahii var. asahii CBS 8904]